jgi:hypothetical protein
MLLIFLIALYLSGIFFAAGLLARRILGIGIHSSIGGEEFRMDFGMTYILGMCLITTICSIVSIFTGVGWEVHALILGILILTPGFSITRRKFVDYAVSDGINFRSVPGLLCLLLGAWFLFVSAGGPCRMPDTQSYHLAAVKWVEEFGVVPGLANLQFRLGANSSWHVLAAFLQGGLSGFATYLAGPISYIVFVLICLPGMNSVWKKSETTSSNVLQTAGFVCLAVPCGWLMGSLGTDFIVFTISFAALVIVTKQAESLNCQMGRETSASDAVPILAAAVSGFAITIKFFAAPLVLLVLISLWLSPGRPTSKFLKCFLIGVAIVTPFLVRNVLICGYLIYPSTAFDFFNVDWKVPSDDVKKFSELAIQWGYLSTNSIKQSVGLENLGVGDKITLWLDTWVIKNMSGDQCFPIFAMLLFGFVGTVGSLVLVRLGRLQSLGFWPFLLISSPFLLGLTLNAITGPVPRYIYFNIFCASIPATSAFLAYLFSKNNIFRHVSRFFLTGFILYGVWVDMLGYGFGGLVLRGANGYGVGYQSILIPKPHPEPQLQEVKSLHGAPSFIAGSVLFSPLEIIYPERILDEILTIRSPLHHFLRNKIQPNMQDQSNFKPTAETLANELNEIISFNRFRDIPGIRQMLWSEEANRSLDWDAPPRVPLVGENGLLLTEAFAPSIRTLPNREFYYIWNSKLPSTDFPHPYLKMRGNTIREGYSVSAPMPARLWEWTPREVEQVIKKWGIGSAYVR